MKLNKYKPSVKDNNRLRDEVQGELKSLIYKLERGKYDESLDADVIADIAEQLRAASEGLAYSLGTGEENVGAIAEAALKQIKELKKQSGQELTNRIESAADELIFSLNLWKDVLDGNAIPENEEDVKRARIKGIRKRLNARLAELDEIKTGFVENDKRLNHEIAAEEKDLAELDEQLLKEDNERKINDLYRRIQATKSKIDMMSTRHNNYSACFNLLDVIYANAREILTAADTAADEIAKAKVLLNIGKLRKVQTEPDKALAILRRMDRDIKEIAAKTASIDEKVSNLNTGSTSVNADALQYKEELMRKKREKEGLADALAAEGKVPVTDVKKVEEDN